LEPLVQLQPSEEIRDRFIPSKSSIIEEIRHYPKNEFLFPPAAWVHPRQGEIEYKNQTWEYFFHGGGLSFFDNQSPKSDISIEFSRDGHIALTAYTFECYLDTVSLRKNKPIYRTILHQHEKLLGQLIQLGHLIPVTPILIQDDQTYILAPSVQKSPILLAMPAQMRIEMMFEYFLEQEGFSVLNADTPDEALIIAKSQQLHCIVADAEWMIANLDEGSLLDNIRGRIPTITLVHSAHKEGIKKAYSQINKVYQPPFHYYYWLPLPIYIKELIRSLRKIGVDEDWFY
jgi:hypothetical protein